jgi:hypothetical protein
VAAVIEARIPAKSAIAYAVRKRLSVLLIAVRRGVTDGQPIAVRARGMT